MDTIKQLSALGMTPNKALEGEPFELEVLDLKTAKKEKWQDVTNAEDSHDIINAYAADLSSTLRAKEELEDEREELEGQVNHLSQENGELTQALQTGHVVDQRIDELTDVMDDMEGQLHQVLDHKRNLDQELEDLRNEVKILRTEKEQHEGELTQIVAERDSYLAEIEELRSQVDALRDENNNLVEAVERKDFELGQFDELYDELEGKVNTVLDNFHQYLVDKGVKFKTIK